MASAGTAAAPASENPSGNTKFADKLPAKESHAFLVFLISHKSWCSIWEDPSVGNCHQITSPIFSFVITI
ncbi:unnamed protein product [Prunus brigantina]